MSQYSRSLPVSFRSIYLRRVRHQMSCRRLPHAGSEQRRDRSNVQPVTRIDECLWCRFWQGRKRGHGALSRHISAGHIDFHSGKIVVQLKAQGMVFLCSADMRGGFAWNLANHLPNVLSSNGIEPTIIHHYARVAEFLFNSLKDFGDRRRVRQVAAEF